MSSQNANALIDCLQRARKVLQHEQRTNYQDRAIRPGGLETFAAIWAEQASTALTEVGLGTAPVHRFLTHLEGYRQQDPIQRAANLRAALSILDDLENTKQTDPPKSTARIPVLQASSASPASHPFSQDNAIKRAASGQTEKATREVTKPASRPVPQNRVHLEAGTTHGHASMTLLNAEVTAIPGVGATVAGKLRYLGIHTVRDLLFYFPRDHRDYSKLIK